MPQFAIKKDEIDYSLYLVTDQTPAILGDRDIGEVVEAALRGGVTMVQLRDKTSDTGDLVRTAQMLHSITKRYKVPLVINDRVDVVLAVGCEGVHVGQDDMNLHTARRILGPEKLIGVSASTLTEALAACQGGADYLGIGTVFATPTKTNTKKIIGPAGVGEILGALRQKNIKVPAVCIGGINASNVRRVINRSAVFAKNALNGVAVVRPIMASPDPESDARLMRDRLRASLLEPGGPQASMIKEGDEMATLVPDIIKAVHDKKPLTHNMTNQVVQNFAANVAIAGGASPIMSNHGEEAADLCKLGGALVVNMGTVTPDALRNYVLAMLAYTNARRPVVLDPVGAGATQLRRSAVYEILHSHPKPSVIKGNEGEILAVLGQVDADAAVKFPDYQQQQRGVDNNSALSPDLKVKLVRALASCTKRLVALTGPSDYVCDGRSKAGPSERPTVWRIDNGHPLMGDVSGMGCVLGTLISAFLAPGLHDEADSVVAAMVYFEVAAERAVEAISGADGKPKGPASFVIALVDELWRLRMDVVNDRVEDLLKRAKIARID